VTSRLLTISLVANSKILEFGLEEQCGASIFWKGHERAPVGRFHPADGLSRGSIELGVQLRSACLQSDSLSPFIFIPQVHSAGVNLF
jgi:hypothetical protein